MYVCSGVSGCVLMCVVGVFVACRTVHMDSLGECIDWEEGE